MVITRERLAGHARRRGAPRPDDPRRRERPAGGDRPPRDLARRPRDARGPARHGRGRVPDRRLRRSHRRADRLAARRARRARSCAACATTSAATRTARRCWRRSTRSSTSTSTRRRRGARRASARSSGVSVSVHRGRVLLQARAALGARDRHDVLALRQQPRERDLRRRRVVARGDRLRRARRARGSRPSPPSGSAGCSCGSRRAGTAAARACRSHDGALGRGGNRRRRSVRRRLHVRRADRARDRGPEHSRGPRDQPGARPTRHARAHSCRLEHLLEPSATPPRGAGVPVRRAVPCGPADRPGIRCRRNGLDGRARNPPGGDPHKARAAPLPRRPSSPSR